MKQVKMTKTKKQKTTLKQKSMKKSTIKTREFLGPKASESKTTAPGAGFHPHQDALDQADRIIKKLVDGPVPPEFIAAANKLDELERPYLEGPENTNARYILVCVDRDVPVPGRKMLDALKQSGVDWVSTIYTDPKYIKELVQKL